jgi:hypothetical protein
MHVVSNLAMTALLTRLCCYRYYSLLVPATISVTFFAVRLGRGPSAPRCPCAHPDALCLHISCDQPHCSTTRWLSHHCTSHGKALSRRLLAGVRQLVQPQAVQAQLVRRSNSFTSLASSAGHADPYLSRLIGECSKAQPATNAPTQGPVLHMWLCACVLLVRNKFCCACMLPCSLQYFDTPHLA